MKNTINWIIVSLVEVYAMTSFLTTGGIRGNKNSVGKFQLRGFNMGVSKPVFESLKGFLGLGFRGEDIDFCLRLWRNGYATRFFENCTIFHKRRTSFIKFAKQVYDFGIMRPILNQRYPEYSKITFWFPTLFLVFNIFSLLSLGLYFWMLAPILLLPFIFLISYDLLIFLDASFKQKSLFLGLLALVATKLQFFVYGSGFLKSFILLNLLKKDPKAAFPHFFYRS